MKPGNDNVSIVHLSKMDLLISNRILDSVKFMVSKKMHLCSHTFVKQDKSYPAHSSLSKLLYCIASARCSGLISSLPARSAMVRDTLWIWSKGHGETIHVYVTRSKFYLTPSTASILRSSIIMFAMIGAISFFYPVVVCSIALPPSKTTA